MRCVAMFHNRKNTEFPYVAMLSQIENYNVCLSGNGCCTIRRDITRYMDRNVSRPLVDRHALPFGKIAQYNSSCTLFGNILPLFG